MRNLVELLSYISLPPILVALSTGLIDLFPGYVFSYFSSFISSTPLLIFIYPQLLSMRGTIGGIFSGRLSTSLHLGEIRPQLMDNTPIFYTLLSVITTLYLVAALIISLFSALFSLLMYSVALSKLYLMIIHILSTFSLTELSIIPLSLLVAKVSYRRGWDPDVITYPFTSSFGDLFITIYFVMVSYFIYAYNWLLLVLIFISPLIVLPIIFTRIGLDKDLYFREFSESLLALILSGFLVLFTGHLMKVLGSKIVLRKYIYFVYPALLTTIGDVGSIIGSSATTELSISGSIFHNYRPLIYLAIFTLLIPFIFITYTMFGHFLVGVDSSPFTEYLGIGLAGLLSTVAIGIYSLVIAYITFMKSLDPDHFVIPIESTSADLLTTFILYTLLTMF